ncbi:MAG: hypothetical protein ACI8R9_001433 [Paraglaciecola sp.]|jgi:hypothetical protein
MASLHTFSDTRFTHKLERVSIHNHQRLAGFFAANEQHKWTYVIANNLVFCTEQPHVLQLKKPDKAAIAQWLEKIICGGQCAMLFVEQLNLDEISKARIMQLCVDHNVLLVNVSLSQVKRAKVIQGPWTNALNGHGL